MHRGARKSTAFYLAYRSETDGKEQYEGLSLYRAETRKVKDAVDVLTDQAGIEDFLPEV